MPFTRQPDERETDVRVTRHLPGTLSWIDSGTPDPTDAARFYSTLFGCTVDDAPPEAFGYRMCMLNGRPIAGLGLQMNADMPPWWTTYVSVDDTGEPSGAIEFHGSVFGWVPKTDDIDHGSYPEFLVDNRTIAGMMPMQGDMWPEAIPNHWPVFFAVLDTDAAAALVTELGGTVSVPPSDIPGGSLRRGERSSGRRGGRRCRGHGLAGLGHLELLAGLYFVGVRDAVICGKVCRLDPELLGDTEQRFALLHHVDQGNRGGGRRCRRRGRCGDDRWQCVAG